MDARYNVRVDAGRTCEEVRAAQAAAGRASASGTLLLARVLGGALAVLLVVAGYLRLEEATRGYYTKLLRLAAFVRAGAGRRRGCG